MSSKVARSGRVEEEDKIKNALLKKALGYDASDVVEEYSFNDEGELTLSKKKVTTKHYGADISAVKMLLERYYKTYEDKILSMSDEDLQEEKNRLLQQLQKGENGGN